MEKRCASFFYRAARRLNIPNFLDFIFYSALLSLHNIIDGRETAATIRLSVGSSSLDVHGESETLSTSGEGERKFTESLLQTLGKQIRKFFLS